MPGILVVLLLALLWLFASVWIINEYERGVVFRLGRVLGPRVEAGAGESRHGEDSQSPRTHGRPHDFSSLTL